MMNSNSASGVHNNKRSADSEDEFEYEYDDQETEVTHFSVT